MGPPNPLLPCRYAPDCPLTFTTEDELLYHLQDPEHDYCVKCDVCCKDWEDYLKHLGEAGCQIACTYCGLELKSQGGLNKHIKQEHKAAQRLHCDGCDEVFLSAASLIGHIEKGKCSNRAHPQQAITKADLQDHVKQKKFVHNLLHKDHKSIVKNQDWNKDRLSQAYLKSCNSNLTDENELPIAGLSLQDAGHACEETDHDQETVTQIDDETSISTETTNVHNNFKQVSPANAWSQQPNELYDFEAQILSARTGYEVPRQSVGQAWESAGAPQNFLHHSPWTSVFEPNKGSSNAWTRGLKSPNLFNTRWWDPSSSCFNVEQFFCPPMECYLCPHDNCSFKDTSPSAMSRHLLDSHSPESFPCPSCRRKFTNLEGLVRHCETSTARCRISKWKNYAELMHRLTGGYIDATQQNERGEIIYKADQPEEFADRRNTRIYSMW